MKERKTPLIFHRAVGLLGAALIVLPVAFASESGPGDEGISHTSFGATPPRFGPDDIGTLPDEAPEEGPHFFLTGNLPELQSVLVDVTGPGKVNLRQISETSDRMLLTFEGDVVVTLDLEALAASEVSVGYNASPSFAGGFAQVYAGGVWGSAVPVETFNSRDLPVMDIWGLGGTVVLLATNPVAELYTLKMNCAGSTMTLSQNLN